jgi:hypothetical protein
MRYQLIAGPEELNDVRIQWVSGRPGEAPAYGGTGFIITEDGRIAAVYLFSTSYCDLDFAVRRPTRGIRKWREEYFGSLKLLCLKRNIVVETLSYYRVSTEKQGNQELGSGQRPVEPIKIWKMPPFVGVSLNWQVTAPQL